MCMCGGAESLVTEAEVARRLGVSRARVLELATQPDFPASLGTITASSPPYGSVPFWRWDDVKDWRRTQEPAVV